MSSFGARFGALIKRKRGIEGLTQQALAVKAFGDETFKTRISELENGKVPNPQQKTVDALVVALEITPEELTACRTPPEEPELPKELLENLSQRFGHDNPDAPPAELARFLKEKARDFKDMKARLDALGKAEARIANLMAAAEDAIARGRFEEADARLQDAEEMQMQEHTLVQVRAQANLRVERGQAALLSGDADLAADRFLSAGKMFEGLGANDEAASMLRELGDRLYYHALRFGGPGLARSESLYRHILTLWTRKTHAENWAMVQNDLGVALEAQGIRAEGAAAQRLLGEAVTAYRDALGVRTRDASPEDWAMTTMNLAIALQEQGIRAEGAAAQRLLGEAVTAYRDALGVRTRDASPERWAMTTQNLAIALKNQGIRAEGAAAIRLLKDAVAAYETVLEVHQRDTNPADWANTKHNLAVALLDFARIQPERARAHLVEAQSAISEALEIYTAEHMPYDHGLSIGLQGKIEAALRALND